MLFSVACGKRPNHSRNRRHNLDAMEIRANCASVNMGISAACASRSKMLFKEKIWQEYLLGSFLCISYCLKSFVFGLLLVLGFSKLMSR